MIRRWAHFRNVAALLLGAWLAGAIQADVIETQEGAHLVGRVTKIAGGKVYIDTDFAGPLTVNQSHIVRLETDTPVAVRVVGGQRFDGRLSGAEGAVHVATTTGPVDTKVAEIAALWPAGAPEPEALKPPSHRWTFQASVDVNGKSGNHDQLGTAYGLTATLTRPKSALILSTSYNRQISDEVKSADQGRGGADYSNNYSDKNSWYARDVVGFDRIKDERLYDTAAAGAGYDFIKQIHQTLTGRLGLAFRYEDYSQPVTKDIRSVALDIGVNHSWQFDNSLLATRIAIVPTIEDLNNVRITQETDYDIPLAKSAWKLRLSIANDYNSVPGPTLDKLDTTYSARLVLSFDTSYLGRLGLKWR